MSSTMTNYRISEHARHRIHEMQLDIEQVIDAAIDPEISYRGSTRYPAGRSVHVKGDIGVVIHDSSRTIITVIWHRRESRHGG